MKCDGRGMMMLKPIVELKKRLLMRRMESRFEYRDAYYEDLMRVYREALMKAEVGARQADVVRMAVNMEASRFWVSETRALKVVSMMIKGGKIRERVMRKMRRNTREMYSEIYRRVRRRMSEGELLKEAVYAVCNEKAPRMYVSESSFIVLMSRYKKEWFEKRRKRLLSAGQ